MHFYLPNQTGDSAGQIQGLGALDFHWTVARRNLEIVLQIVLQPGRFQVCWHRLVVCNVGKPW